MVRVIPQNNQGSLRVMDRIKEVVRHVPEGISISFEFFPPKEVEKENSLWDALHRLLPLQPKFVSVTYGAGYSDRARTRNLVERIQKTTDIPVSPHLTCVGHTRDQLKDILDSYWQAGVRNLVAVRGDRAPGDTSPLPVPYALDLIELIRSQYAFEIYVAAYPDVHPAAPTARFDLDNLKRKIDAGATAAITQFFFDNNDFLRFRDRCRKAGIQAEIIPGILPVTNFERTKTFADRCGARVPEWFHQYFEGLDEEPETRNFIAAGLAIDQVQELHLEGVNHFHFYTLNRCELTYAICRSLGLRSQRVVAC